MTTNDDNFKLESFVIYNSFYKPISRLTDEQLGRIFRALFRYNIGEEQQIDADIEMAFEFFKNQIERDRKRYQKRVEANRVNGKKGGRPKKETEETQVNRENPLGYLETEETQVNRENPNEAKKAYNYNYNDINKERTSSNEEVPKKGELSLASSQEKSKDSHIDWKAFVDYFNKTFAGKLPNVQKLTDARKQLVKARVAQYSKETIPVVYKKILESDFLMGDNDRSWRPDFDWIFKAANFTKILEGVYSNDARPARKNKANNITSVNDEWENRR